MPWTESRVEDEKLRFVAACLAGEHSMTALCAAFGISRQTGYEILRRYRAEGPAGLAPRSRAPRRRPGAVPEEVAEAVPALRAAHADWGPRKLRAVLAERHPALAWPAPSTIGDLLRRAGLVERRRRPRRPLPATAPFGAVAGPNDTWCADFKGWFRTRDGARCDPLTVSDAHSRFLLACQVVEPRTEPVRAAFERLFEERGLPRALRTDNGPPFASRGAGGLSRLSVWWAKLGIALERIEPGRPQQNGRHERLHGTLQAAVGRTAAADAAELQARLDRFRREYNEERPHEALGQVPPGRAYRPSPRPHPGRAEEPWYDAAHAVRRVRPTGEIKWGGELVFVGEALAGEPVGVAELESGDWLVRFAAVELGILDRRTGRFRRFGPARPGRPEAPNQPGTPSPMSPV